MGPRECYRSEEEVDIYEDIEGKLAVGIHTTFTKTGALALTVCALILLGGCAIDRSRDLNNPRVSAKTMAEQVCSNCHGVTGNSISPNFPRIAGQPEGYLQEQLTAFRGHNRQDPAGFEYMWGLSRNLTDDQIAGLAEYFSSQTPTRNSSGAQPLMSEGQAIFTDGLPDQHVPACATCHGDKGQGQAHFPRLAGQWSDYVQKQLRVFQRTDERPEGAVMKVVAHGLRDPQIEAVAVYLQGIAPG